MDHNDQRELKKIVELDKAHIANFLKAHQLKLKGKIELRFNDGISKKFKQLWELNSEPLKVKAHFAIANPGDDQRKQILITLQLLIDKLVNRAFPQNLNDSNEYLETISNICRHFSSIKFTDSSEGISISLTGQICYCS